MSKQPVSPVSIHALRQRLNRRLASEGKALRTARSDRARERLGKFYVIADDKIIATNVDISALARKMNLLRAWETAAP